MAFKNMCHKIRVHIESTRLSPNNPIGGGGKGKTPPALSKITLDYPMRVCTKAHVLKIGDERG